jgi:hypothetical protein
MILRAQSYLLTEKVITLTTAGKQTKDCYPKRLKLSLFVIHGNDALFFVPQQLNKTKYGQTNNQSP